MSQAERTAAKAYLDFKAQRLADSRFLITPEGVPLRIELAGMGQRLSALIVDLLIMGAILLGVGLLVLLSALGFLAAEGENKPLTEVFPQVASSVFSLTLFVLRWFYFTIFELTPRGATPGKRIVKIRIASRNGGRLSVDAVLVRNLFRELEVFLPLGLLLSGLVLDPRLTFVLWCLLGVFILFPHFNRDRLRVGDLIAGTWVIQTPRPRLGADLSEAVILTESLNDYDFTPAQLEAYGEAELKVLEDVLRENNRDVLKRVALRIQRKIDWHGPSVTAPRDFLQTYYTALRAHLEHRMLMGRRRKDKHDR
ncbi:MAG: RDD family protein [Asticcacaulis sp.]